MIQRKGAALSAIAPTGLVYSLNDADSQNTRQDGESRAEVFALINSDGIVKASRDYQPTTPDVITIYKADLSDDVAVAMAELAEAMPKEYTTPCRENPAAWDAPRITRAAGPRYLSVVEQVRDACEACLDCYVFVHCMKVANANRRQDPPAIEGILAGELHDNTSSGALVRSSMEELKWTA